MKITIDKGELVDALGPAAKICSKSTVDYLACVLIRTDDGTVSFTATDQQESVEIVKHALVENDGCSLVPANRLIGVAKSMPDGAVTVECDETAVISSGRIKAEMPVLNPLDFPSFPTVTAEQSVSIDAKAFKNAVDCVLPFAYRKDDTRPILSCILLSVGEGLMSVMATDSYRIAKFETECESAENLRIPIPISFAQSVADDVSDGSVDLSFSDSMACARYGETVRVCRLVEGRYPNASTFFETDKNCVATLPRGDLKQSVARSIAACSGNFPLKCSVDGSTITLERKGDNSESFIEQVDLSRCQGENNIKVSSHYAMSAVNAIDGETVTIDIDGPLKPLVMYGGHVTSVIMPVR